MEVTRAKRQGKYTKNPRRRVLKGGLEASTSLPKPVKKEGPRARSSAACGVDPFLIAPGELKTSKHGLSLHGCPVRVAKSQCHTKKARTIIVLTRAFESFVFPKNVPRQFLDHPGGLENPEWLRNDTRKKLWALSGTQKGTGPGRI